MKKVLLLPFAVLLFSQTAKAATYYVDAVNGNNSNSCAQAQNIATPKLTFGNFGGQGVIPCMAPGDTLYVRSGGMFHEAVYFNFNPWPGLRAKNPPVPSGIDNAHRTVVMKYPGDSALPNPVLGLQDSENGGYGLGGAHFVTIDGIDLDGTGWSTDPTSSFIGFAGGNDNQNVTLQNFEVRHPGYNGFVMGGDMQDVLFKNIKIRHGDYLCKGSPGAHAFYLNANTPTTGHPTILDGIEITDWEVPAGTSCGNGFAIQIYQYGAGSNIFMDGWIVRNSYIHDNAAPAMVIGTGSNFQVYNNVFANNGSAAIGAVSGVDTGFNLTNGINVYNNTFYGNGPGYALGNGGYGKVNNAHYANNIIFNNGNGDRFAPNGDPNFNPDYHYTQDHNLNGIDPHFANAANGDFHVQSGGPAAGIGADFSSVFTTDKDGKTRVVPNAPIRRR